MPITSVKEHVVDRVQRERRVRANRRLSPRWTCILAFLAAGGSQAVGAGWHVLFTRGTQPAQTPGWV